jgi:predicted lipoprotein with Yx(FWY)xxD motif
VTPSRLRRSVLVVPAALLVTAVLCAACGGAGVTTLSAPPTPDTPTHSACLNDGCVLQWPPLIVNGPVRLGRGLDRTLVGTLRRPDGSTQLSYGGHPLYQYDLDVSPGVVMGQAIDQDGGPWYVLNARGQQITTAFTVTPSNGSG